jgi:Fe2+ or Zn2+ uptake regulation protein
MTRDNKLEEAKRLYQNANADQRYMIERLFPELKDTEDERIRKAIYNALKYLETELYCDFLDDVDILDAYAWLEKQGKQTHSTLCQSEVTKTSDQELEQKFKVGD